jgi:hypothetical protein
MFWEVGGGDRKEIILWLVGMSLVCYYEALAGILEEEEEADPGMCWYNVSACLVTMAGVVKVSYKQNKKGERRRRMLDNSCTHKLLPPPLPRKKGEEDK